MNPLLFFGLLALGGVGLVAADRSMAKKKEDGTPVSVLVKGKDYRVKAVVLHSITESPQYAALAVQYANAGQAITMTDVLRAVQAILTSAFNQSGATVLVTPQPDSVIEQENLLSGKPSTWDFEIRWNLDQPAIILSGKPSTWDFEMRWNLDQPAITNVLPWLAGAAFYAK